MSKKPLLVIEHCELSLSEWLLLEYRHSVKIWGKNSIFTNIKNKKIINILKTFTKTEKKNAKELLKNKKCIILDPQSKKTLKTNDFINLYAIIIGGILGYKKPRGRTKKLISDKCRFQTRNLGKMQLTIDGAVFVAKQIALGKKLNDIEIAYELEIIHDPIHSTILPFGYPILNNKPIITPGLIEYLSEDNSI
jgi:ribosome biogenesis SPOUT family RNA methylase Rps3